MACTPSRVAEPAFVACSLTLQHLFVRPPPSRLKALRTSVSSFPLGHQKSVILMTFPSLRVTTLVLRFLSSYCHFSMGGSLLRSTFLFLGSPRISKTVALSIPTAISPLEAASLYSAGKLCFATSWRSEDVSTKGSR